MMMISQSYYPFIQLAYQKCNIHVSNMKRLQSQWKLINQDRNCHLSWFNEPQKIKCHTSEQWFKVDNIYKTASFRIYVLPKKSFCQRIFLRNMARTELAFWIYEPSCSIKRNKEIYKQKSSQRLSLNLETTSTRF